MPAVAVITGTAGAVLRARIAVQRDIKLAQLALHDVEPAQRSEVLDKLARLAPFSPTTPGTEPRQPVAPDQALERYARETIRWRWMMRTWSGWSARASTCN